jgi:hypothetical protein
MSAFGIIFQVNNAIGKAVREHPESRQALLDLQVNVNAITVSLKMKDSARVVVALDASLRSFGKLMEERGSPKKNL